jgi:hypothetical protein
MSDYQLTYGEKLIRVQFNPSASDDVTLCKNAFAREIDRLNAKFFGADEVEKKTIEEAIKQIETAAMWAVKALTYKF